MSNPFIMTPYYRTFVTLDGRDEAQETETNYTPYNLFCLSTRIGRDLARRGSKDYPVFIGQPMNGKMQIIIKLLRIDQHVDLSMDEIKEVQKMVDRALADRPQHCVLFSLDTMRFPYPRAWMMSILPYLQIPAKYNPFIEENSIYLQFQTMDYLVEYNQLSLSIVDQLKDLYTIGSMVGNQELALKWDLLLFPSLPQEIITSQDILEYATKSSSQKANYLIKVSGEKAEFELQRGLDLDDQADLTAAERSDNTGLYISRWKDRRFAPDLSKFLLERANGAENIEIDVGLSFVTRHAITRKINQHFPEIIPLFSGDKLFLPAQNLKRARTLAALVEEGKRTAVGKTLFFPVSFEDVQNYRLAAENLFGPGQSQTLFYRVDDPTRPLIISIQVPYSTDIMMATIELQNMIRPEKKVLE